MKTKNLTNENRLVSKLAAINLQELRGAAGEKIYERGEAYFRWGRVEIDELTNSIAICYVQGSRLYRVNLSVANEHLYMDCDCPYSENGWICKHHVAAALAVFNRLHEQEHFDWQKQLTKILGIKPGGSRGPRAHPYYLFFSLQPDGPVSWKLAPYILPLSAFPPSHRNQEEALPPEILQEMLENNPELDFHLSKPTTILQARRCLNCNQEHVMLANLISDRSRAFGYYPTSFPLPDYLTLAAALQSPVYLGTVEHPVQTKLEILPEAGQIHLEILKNEDGLNMRACAVFHQSSIALERGETRVLYTNPLWALAGSTVFQINDSKNLEAIIEWIKMPDVFVPQEEETNFLEKFFLPLAESFPLEGATVDRETLHTDLVKRLYLSETAGKLQVQLRFGYQEFELAYEPDPPKKSLRRRPNSWTLVEVERQILKEEAVYRSLSEPKYRLKRLTRTSDAGYFGLRGRTHPISFLLHSIPLLTKDGFEIYGEEELKTIQVNRNKPSLNFSISSGTDWFDLQVSIQFGELKVSLSEIRKVLRRKERYIKLADGSIGEIPENWLERYKYIFGLGKENRGGLRFSNTQIGLLDQLLEEENQLKVDWEFRRRRERLRSFAGISARPLPESFKGELRPYQKAGYDWLHFLNQFGFGGCLADDMGLGKTVQALVYLQSQYENSPKGQPASLVVVPRSLLVNWQREASRFTPELRLLEFFNQDRTKDLAIFNQYDVIITTYGIMRRDIGLLRKYTFQHIILDESQIIKNPLSQTSRAARHLAAKQRLALTGTPVENSTAELWSLFAFLNPGLLGSLDFYKREFSGPIEKKGDELAAETLRKMVFPFILRRTKKQVAPELPPRTDRILYCDMEPAQRKFYQRMRDTYRGLLLGMLEKEGINASRMKFLEGLLRLRQISNHPRLVEEHFRGTSGKFELLLETLTTLKAEGHKVLVFSQFVQMLKILRQSLDQHKVPYLYLDGQTRNRQERVDEFQTNEDIPFFLISLKAGGVGLNLTAADYVIHIDPWWNPAVEMQATDRTHRIGQEKPVFVYKFITRDSVEEKILILQERKRELVNTLISSEKGFLKSLTSDDIQVLFGS
jgi:non-specific serine/threonine protein kinase